MNQINTYLKLAVAGLLIGAAPILASAQDEESSSGWRNVVALTYVSGLSDMMDAIEKNYSYVDTFEWPVGLSYQGYYLMDSGFGFGMTIGPIVGVFGDINAYVIPLGLDVRYKMKTGSKMAVILRAGARYPFTSGDHMEGSSLGFIGAVALEFPIRSGRMAWGIEAGYDSSEIEVEAGNTIEDVKPYEFNASIFLRF